MNSLALNYGAASRRALAAFVAFVMAAVLAVAATPRADAAPRDYLRADATGTCDWDGVGWWVQRCDVWSPSMNRMITVQIQPAQRGGNAGLYLLDGLRATEETNAWVHDVNAAQMFVDNNITLVMPVGGNSSFYMDWEGPANYDPAHPVNYQWETFLTQELPVYLENNFGVARNNNSIAGLSMGGTAAVRIAGKHPDQFRQVLSLSGFLATTLPGAHTFMRFALLDGGLYNVNNMYGSMFSPRRFEADPMNQIAGLRNTDVYIAAASGIPSAADLPIAFGNQISGFILEIFSNVTTRLWELKARAMGINVTSDYPALGEHTWNTFGAELGNARGRILDVMNAW